MLAAEEIERQRLAAEKGLRPPDAVDSLISIALPFALLATLMASVGVPLWALRTWRGAWRIAASVPALAVLATLFKIVVDTTVEPTSHNLWPFEILIVGTFAILVISALAVCRRFIAPARA